MHHHYDDILSRIAEPPQWFDEHAVPRFAPFEPLLCTNIYAEEAALVEIECQACHHAFAVAFTQSMSERVMRLYRLRNQGAAPGLDVSLANAIRTREIDFGDPPNIRCCPAGPTMNSEPRRVLQFWRRSKDLFSWERDSSLEVELTDAPEEGCTS